MSSYIQSYSAPLGICLSPRWVRTLTPTKFPAKRLSQGASFFNGQFGRITAEPNGEPHRDWINNIPNEGLIYYTTLLNQGRLFITSPQAMSEVLTTKVILCLSMKTSADSSDQELRFYQAGTAEKWIGQSVGRRHSFS